MRTIEDYRRENDPALLEENRKRAAEKHASRGQKIRANSGYAPQDIVFTNWLDDELAAMRKQVPNKTSESIAEDLEENRKRAAEKFSRLGTPNANR